MPWTLTNTSIFLQGFVMDHANSVQSRSLKTTKILFIKVSEVTNVIEDI